MDARYAFMFAASWLRPVCVILGLQRKTMSALQLFAVNAKPKGKVHRVSKDTAHLPPSQHRLRCGWHVTRSTSLVYKCSRVAKREFCLKCFPEVAGMNDRQKIEELVCAGTATGIAKVPRSVSAVTAQNPLSKRM